MTAAERLSAQLREVRASLGRIETPSPGEVLDRIAASREQGRAPQNGGQGR